MSALLERAAQLALECARQMGVDQAEVAAHTGTGVSVTARQQELETVEKNNDAELAVTVFHQHRTGSASSADMSEQGIRQTVAAARSIAEKTGADECFGLADPTRLASTPIDLDLHHTWDADIKAFSELALECEQSALDVSSNITNTEGASVNSYSGSAVYANSHGFFSRQSASQHSVGCSVIAGTGDHMQRDYWYDSNRNPTRLAAVGDIGQRAGERTLARLGARKIASSQSPVLFDPQMAKSLIGHCLAALRGGLIYKQASFLYQRIGDRIFPEFIRISEHPHLPGKAGSAWHDAEGVATPAERDVVSGGRVESYLLGSYTARKLGLDSTANAGGARNIRISDSGQTQDQLLSQMNRGLFVTELIGSGINTVTGDYSRGAGGFWVENGEIQHPVEEVTIAGNLLDMFANFAAVGNDIDSRGNTASGSILIADMTIAGS